MDCSAHPQMRMYMYSLSSGRSHLDSEGTYCSPLYIFYVQLGGHSIKHKNSAREVLLTLVHEDLGDASGGGKSSAYSKLLLIGKKSIRLTSQWPSQLLSLQGHCDQYYQVTGNLVNVRPLVSKSARCLQQAHIHHALQDLHIYYLEDCKYKSPKIIIM